jgi:predicted ArsR family transcriptional regulator
MNDALNKQAESRRRSTLALLHRINTEWVSADYLRHKLSCTKHQVRRDIELLETNKMVVCQQLLDIRDEGVGISDEAIEKPRTAKTVIVKLTSRGTKMAERIPPWTVDI